MLLFGWDDSVNEDSPSRSSFFAGITVQSRNVYPFPIIVHTDVFLFPILVGFSIANLKHSKDCESAYKNIEIGFTLCTCGVYFL